MVRTLLLSAHYSYRDAVQMTSFVAKAWGARVLWSAAAKADLQDRPGDQPERKLGGLVGPSGCRCRMPAAEQRSVFYLSH